MPEVKGFKYVYSVGQINDILDKIKETGRSDKLTITYVQNTWLLKNAQYSAVLDLFKDMGLLAADGTPTEAYAELQNPEHYGRALAAGIKKAYPSLFRAYPNAQELPKEKLEGYLKQQTGADKAIIEKIYGTIKRLCSLADFSTASSASSSTGQAGSQSGAPP